MSRWSGDLVLFAVGGQYYVSSALGISHASNIRFYHVSGPKIPCSWPEATAIGDPAKWIEEKRLQGFCFRARGS